MRDGEQERERKQALAAALEIKLDLPAPCLPGVIENRRLLERHHALLERFLERHPEA